MAPQRVQGVRRRKVLDPKRSDAARSFDGTVDADEEGEKGTVVQGDEAVDEACADHLRGKRRHQDSGAAKADRGDIQGDAFRSVASSLPKGSQHAVCDGSGKVPVAQMYPSRWLMGAPRSRPRFRNFTLIRKIFVTSHPTTWQVSVYGIALSSAKSDN